MKASKFTDAQKAFIIKQGVEGTPVAELCRKAGIHWPTGECAAIADRQPSDLLQLEEVAGEGRQTNDPVDRW
jgi:putative transposase